MSAPDRVLRLIEQFDRDKDSLKSGDYNESQLRQHFLDPFFEVLGWDMRNTSGKRLDRLDVVQEAKVTTADGRKRPDYAFNIDGQVRFYVEAKKPRINIKTGASEAFQLRSYGWSRQLPLNILSDFEELAVYDCRYEPTYTDPASQGRIKYLTYDQYEANWDWIDQTFSYRAVEAGSLSAYAASLKEQRGFMTVDATFLRDLSNWRKELASGIMLEKPELSQPELNYAVQMTLDRIIFLRICEDLELEPYGRLKQIQESDTNIYVQLCDLFKTADKRYNSGLFHFSDVRGQGEAADNFTLKLKIGNKPFWNMIQRLYFPAPYKFDALPVEILGQVYEQFLGQVIVLTPEKNIEVQLKPEVRKAGGVYYTPSYIVDYIVRSTVGKLLEGRSPSEVEKLTVLDPACGSGSFLLGAYKFLLNWYLEQYRRDPEKYRAVLHEGQGGTFRLTVAERRRILQAHIFGVDLDAQAVEVTKLSLLLQILEGLSPLDVEPLKRANRQILPDLAKNIKGGNSLIGPDFPTTGLSLEELARISPFDWQTEFPAIMASGGFDAVIGNPPYVRQEGLGDTKEYFLSHYKTFKSTADLYVNFIEKELNLLKPSGLFGMIVSNKWFRAAYGQPLREFLSNDVTIQQIIDLAGLPVFTDATVRTIILICSPQPKQSETLKYLAPMPLDEFRTVKSSERLQQVVEEKAIPLNISNLSPKGWSFSGNEAQKLILHMKQNSIPLQKYMNGKPCFGIKTGLNEAFIIDSNTRAQLIAEDAKSAEIIKPLLGGRDVRRYIANFDAKYLIWTYIGVAIKEYPAIFKHLTKFQPQLEKRWDKGHYWWELRACDYYDKFEKPKIIYPDIATNCRFTLDRVGYFSANTTYFIPGDDLYLLGLLNSQLGQFYFTDVCAGLEGGGTTYLRFFGQYLENFPIFTINFENNTGGGQ